MLSMNAQTWDTAIEERAGYQINEAKKHSPKNGKKGKYASAFSDWSFKFHNLNGNN